MEKTFIAAQASFRASRAVVLGCPFDGTASFRPGARFGPGAIRKASWGIETYSPSQGRDLTEVRIHDMGDLELPLGDKKASLRLIRRGVREILAARKFPILLGGDHLITLPAIEEMIRVYPGLHVVQLDAHWDLREDYLGEDLSHSTVMRNVTDHIGRGKLFQIGIRSGTKEEFRLAKKMGSRISPDSTSLRSMIRRLQNQPVYVSFDLDLLDPGLMPGVGTPEPGGFTFRECMALLKTLQPLPVVGFDLVELTPDYDPAQVSAVTASVLLREMILAFCH